MTEPRTLDRDPDPIPAARRYHAANHADFVWSIDDDFEHCQMPTCVMARRARRMLDWQPPRPDADSELSR